jgi:hypothetical protein
MHCRWSPSSTAPGVHSSSAVIVLDQQQHVVAQLMMHHRSGCQQDQGVALNLGPQQPRLYHSAPLFRVIANVYMLVAQLCLTYMADMHALQAARQAGLATDLTSKLSTVFAPSDDVSGWSWAVQTSSPGNTAPYHDEALHVSVKTVSWASGSQDPHRILAGDSCCSSLCCAWHIAGCRSIRCRQPISCH